jgi:hypothetical protein
MELTERDKALHQLRVDGYPIYFTTSNGRDFSRLRGERIKECQLLSLRDALIEFAKVTPKPPGLEYETLETGELIPVSLMVKNPQPLPWDDFAVISIDFTASTKIRLWTALYAAQRISHDAAWAAIEPIIRRYGFDIRHLRGMEGESYALEGASAKEWEIDAEVDAASLKLGTLFDIHLELGHSIFYSGTSVASARQAFELVKLGRVTQLLGLHECEWLEVKQSAYDLKNNGQLWKLELSQDVASFANGTQGCLIIIGIGTRNIDGSDVLSKVQPVPPLGSRVRRYHDVLHSHVYPPIDSLDIVDLEEANGRLICIYFPSQPDHLKPFIVSGGRASKQHQGGMFSIVQRRVEDTKVLNARDLHAQIVAGRTLLRSGVTLPQSSDRQGTPSRPSELK